MASPANSSGLLQVDNDGGGGVTLVAGFTFTAGRSAVLTLGHFASTENISAVTIGGTAAVLDSSRDKFQSSGSSARIYRAVNMVGGTNEVVITDIFNRRNGRTLEPTGYLPAFLDSLVAKQLLDPKFLYGQPG